MFISNWASSPISESYCFIFKALSKCLSLRETLNIFNSFLRSPFNFSVLSLSAFVILSILAAFSFMSAVGTALAYGAAIAACVAPPSALGAETFGVEACSVGTSPTEGVGFWFLALSKSSILVLISFLTSLPIYLVGLVSISFFPASLSLTPGAV